MSDRAERVPAASRLDGAPLGPHGPGHGRAEQLRRRPAAAPPDVAPRRVSRFRRPIRAFDSSLFPAPLQWSDLSDRDRDVYEIGFLTGFLMREDEVAQANSDADRFYRIAFDRATRPRRW